MHPVQLIDYYYFVYLCSEFPMKWYVPKIINGNELKKEKVTTQETTAGDDCTE